MTQETGMYVAQDGSEWPSSEMSGAVCIGALDADVEDVRFAPYDEVWNMGISLVTEDGRRAFGAVAAVAREGHVAFLSILRAVGEGCDEFDCWTAASSLIGRRVTVPFYEMADGRLCFSAHSLRLASR